jgi:hypothetical protein
VEDARFAMIEPHRRTCWHGHELATRGVWAAEGLEEGAALGLVDPDLEQARGGDVPVLLAKLVRLAQVRSQRRVVIARLGQHVRGFDVVRVVVEQGAMPWRCVRPT